MATETQTQETPEKFPWESPTPSGAFWARPEGESTGMEQTFMKLYTQAEIDALDLESKADLPRAEKLAIMIELLQKKFGSHDFKDPITLGKDDWDIWHRCEFGISFAESELKNHSAADAIFKERIRVWEARYERGLAHPPYSSCSTDLSALTGLSGSAYEEARYSEAEELIAKVLPLLRSHPRLGEDAPQVLGSMRLLMHVYGKEGRFDEALELNRRGFELISGMGKGRFAKYQADEEEEMQRVKKVIEGWKGEKEAGKA